MSQYVSQRAKNMYTMKNCSRDIGDIPESPNSF